MKTFTEALVLRAFEATGIHPPNADVILERFTTPTPPPPVTPPEQTATTAVPADPDWLKTKTLFRSVVKDDAGAKGEAMEQALHQLHVKLDLTIHELQGVKQAQDNKKRKKARQKVLPLYSHNLNRQGGAVWWSPRSKREADMRDAAIKKYNAEQEAAKVSKWEIKHQTKILKEKEREEKRAAREAAKVVRDQAKAEERALIDARKAERARQKQARDAEKNTQLTDRRKRKASCQLQSKITKKRSDGAGRSRVVVHKPSPAPPPTYNTHGRKIAQPKRFE